MRRCNSPSARPRSSLSPDTFTANDGAVREYRPVLVPFIRRRTAVAREALRRLIHRTAQIVLTELSAASEPPISHLASLSAFVAKLKEDHVTRVYTTNYDDFFLQADQDLYTGFSPAPSPVQKSLDRREFWSNRDRDCVFHLHGSVHLSFGLPRAPDADLGALYWYDDRTEASRHSSHGTSDDRRMDGSGTIRTPIITGLDKLSPLQRQPFSHYYASMAHDAMDADIIYVIGCGLADLHLNTWVGEARRRDPKPPLIFVDYWRHSFPSAHPTWAPRKEVEMIHTLRMPFVDHPCLEHGTAWHVDRNRTYAVWDSGFLEFLRAPAELDDILRQLR